MKARERVRRLERSSGRTCAECGHGDGPVRFEFSEDKGGQTKCPRCGRLLAFTFTISHPGGDQ